MGNPNICIANRLINICDNRIGSNPNNNGGSLTSDKIQEPQEKVATSDDGLY